MTFAEILAVYTGSNADATKALYAKLADFGGAGAIATNLFRAHKTSGRAKVYRGGGFKGAAYDTKAWSVGNLCSLLTVDADDLKIRWGWGLDNKATGFEHVFYINIPTGQVSFHMAARLNGPDYDGVWDGQIGAGPGRICRWIETILKGESPMPELRSVVIASIADVEPRQIPDIPLYCITENPSDFPGKFVVRLWNVAAGRATVYCSVWDTLAAARDDIPVGFTRVARDALDDLIVVETYI